MKTIHLPLLSANTTLSVALNSMRWLQKSALVRESGPDLNLVGAGKVVIGLARQKSLLSEVESKVPVQRITNWDATHWGLDLGDPYKTEQSYEQFLDRHGVGYGVVETVPGMALVVTRHEGLADEVSSAPGACYCVGDCQHEHTAPPARDHQICYCNNEILCFPPVP